MVIELEKFGTLLSSHPEKREAFLAFQPTLRTLGEREMLEIDFKGVTTFTPSLADEFLTPLRKKLREWLALRPSNNPSVKATLEILAQNPSTASSS